ncbi:MAG: type VI secretion system membrane subunit TssM [Caulobacteraceae bacterium]|nr:type VI secretion system membrane subunit TssM [Caulobacteraceae bacterium]
MRKIFRNWWVLTITVTLILALALSLALPIIWAPVRPLPMRLLLAGVVVLIWAGFAGWRIYKARRAAAALAKELTPVTPGDAESELLSKRMAEALTGLKSAQGGRRDYLYSRPWYMIIGPPGAGKTTALLNSGLRFPFADSAMKGVGGTRNLDFWFADEAVLVDTAGRYTTQDSDAATDSQAWNSFLKLLRKHRPLQPINGVLVAIGLDELLRADRALIDAHAAAVRRRLIELQRTLEVAAPVYVVFTKADLLAGFVEFYDDLDVEGRRAVLGATLPWTGEPPDSGLLVREFDLMAQAVADRTSKRLQEDLDTRRRSLILGFSAQIDTLRSRALRFLEGAFVAEQNVKVPLRGFYFASGVQEGAPLDRILGGVAQVFDQPHAAPRDGRGRAYFLNRLLGEVIFKEAGLVSDDPKARRRRRTQLIGAMAAIGAVAVITLALWSVSFIANRRLQGELMAAGQGVQQQIRDGGIDLVEVREGDPDLEQTLSVLRALRELPRGYADRRQGAAPLYMRFGLFQSGHSRKAEETYREALRRIMLPRILLRLERVLQDRQAEPLAIYEPLKVYLMLGGLGPMDAKAVKAWVTDDWAAEVFPGGDRESVRKELEQHLDALLEDKEISRAWPGRKAPLDGALIDSARASVQTLTLADRAYAILRQQASAGEAPDWTARAVLSAGHARAFAGGEAVLDLTVPYFFTREGYEKAYQVGVQTVQNELNKDLWVLGQDAKTTGVQSQIASVRPGVAGLYAKEYISQWQKVIDAMQPAAYFADPAAYGAFTLQPSPLKLILLEVRKNTTFSGGAQGAAREALERRVQRSTVGRLGMRAQQGQTNLDAAAQISAYFQPVNAYVGDGKTPAPIDEFVAAVKAAGSATTAAGLTGGGAGGDAVQAQMSLAMAQVATAAAGAPPALQPFVTSAAQGGKTAAVGAAQGAVADAYQRGLLPACRSVTQDRYPFFGAAQSDATAADMLRVFGQNGQVDGFAQSRLASLMDTAGPVWRWRADDPVATLLDPTSAEQMHKAAQIRDLLAAGLPLKVESAGLGGQVTAAEFSAGGATHRFEAGAAGARPIMWSISGLPEARVVLYAGDRELRRFEAQGTWALFRLMDQARRENAGPTALKATFGEGAASATFRIILPSDQNPFSRGGLWSFRCPAAL